MSTHTFVILDISKEAFDEIFSKLKGSYDHTFHEVNGQMVINMHGIALAEHPEKLPQDEVIYERKPYGPDQDPCSWCGKKLREQMKGCKEITCYQQFRNDNDFKRNQIQIGTKEGGEATDREDDSNLPKRD